MAIRRAGPEDSAAVAALLAQLGYPAAPEEVAERLAGVDAGDRVLLAGEGAGLVALHRIPLLAEGGCIARITALVVAAEQRRTGVGRDLIAAAEGAARGWGCDRLEVSAGRRPERAAAHELYRAAGFRDTAGESVRYWKRLR